MKTTTKYLTIFALTAAGLGLAAAGCDSTSTCTDAGVCPDGGAKGGTSGGLGGTSGGLGGSTGAGGAGSGLFKLSYPVGATMATYCFDVTAVAAGASDGCDIGVGVPMDIGLSLPAAYDMTGMITVGKMGSLGAGLIANNNATLLRDGMPADALMPTCTWHQTDTTMFQLIADNTFTVSVVENQSQFAAACTAPPAGGACTSTWMWTMSIDGAKTPPACQ